MAGSRSAEGYSVEEAAAFLGVSPAALLEKRTPTLASRVDWDNIGASEHFVQFYETDEFLAESVGDFLWRGLLAGEAAVVIVTEPRRQDIEERLEMRGVDLAAARESGQYMVFDAERTLAQIMEGDLPDLGQFAEAIGDEVAEVQERWPRTRVFGEMVTLLWQRGLREAAYQLEMFWNQRDCQRPVALFCAYPLDAFGQVRDAEGLAEICGCHTRVMPAEGFSARASPDEQLREITRLQQKARALESVIEQRAQVERELSDFVESSLEGIHKVGADGRILWANQAELDLLGYRREEYLGHHIAEFHADQAVIGDILSKLASGESVINYPARLRAKDGSFRHVLIHSNVCYQGGEFAYTRCFTRDVTERVNAENELMERDRRKDEFLALLAHELRNPLAPLRTGLDLMDMGVHDPGTLDNIRATLRRQTDQLIRLVDDLVDVSRITRGKLELRKSRVVLSDIVRSAVETAQPVISEAGHTLTVQVPDDEVLLDADPHRLSQMLSNLLNNAARYTPKGGAIRLTVEYQQNTVVCSVADNGIGIPADKQASIFEMFAQIERSGTSTGLGIGLTLVKSIVQMHGGRIDVFSDGRGNGSTFRVSLPIVVAAPAASSAGEQQRAAGSRYRVLVVDDNHAAAEMLSAVVQLMDHEVHTAADGRQAIEAAEAFRPDLILMDLGMPTMNGFEAARHIRQQPWGEQIMLVAVTGWGQEQDRQRTREAGFDLHLVKPAELSALKAVFANLEQRRN